MSKIVLIEDDVTMRTLLKTLLEFEGFEVTIYGEIEEDKVAEMLKQENPQALLLDVHLRKGNGITILKSIREDPQIADTRVIMTSGMDMSSQCLDAGADHFLLKPYMPDDLINLLKDRRD